MDSQQEACLKYPFEKMSNDERKAWLDHQRDGWNGWTATLGRIKQDEQRWVSVAILVYGAAIGLVATRGHAVLLAEGDGVAPHLCALQHIGALALLAAVAHGFACVWMGHALTLRVQYYRSMCRMFLAHLALGGRVPREWLCDDPEQWRGDATAPEDSKRAEMLLLAFLVLVTTSLPVFRAGAELCACRVADSHFGGSSLWPVLLLACFALALAWPFLIYPLQDSRRMGRLHQEKRMHELRCKGRRRAKGEAVGSDE